MLCLTRWRVMGDFAGRFQSLEMGRCYLLIMEAKQHFQTTFSWHVVKRVRRHEQRHKCTG